MQAAHAEAARIVDAADGEAERLRRECDAYVDTKLAEFEESLGNALQYGEPQPRASCGGGGPAGAGVGVPPGRSGTGMDLID